mmetsp:Transcript_52481/g.78410  ORF Transcript_52481/g.78410 Transcript_52481/m.78410 type:complete len:89 (+) Transcript_52481:154-420(+)
MLRYYYYYQISMIDSIHQYYFAILCEGSDDALDWGLQSSQSFPSSRLSIKPLFPSTKQSGNVLFVPKLKAAATLVLRNFINHDIVLPS